MDLKGLSTQELKSKIKVCIGTIEMCSHSIRLWRERSDKKRLDAKLAKQWEIIQLAEAESERLVKEFEQAPARVEELKQSITYETSCLTLLRNRADIVKLQELQAKLKLEEVSNA